MYAYSIIMNAMDYSKVVDDIFSQIKDVRFNIILWNNKILKYGQGENIAFTLIFEDAKAAKQLLSQGALGFGESYMEGRIRIEGNLEVYLKLRHQFKNVKWSLRLVLATILANISIPKDRKDQIAYHYDLGNDFFSLFLDRETMSYSAGLYAEGRESLSIAQRKKIELVCDWLNLPKGSSVLDIGSGWGGFAIHAAQKRNWEITCCTLSKKQVSYCKRLIKEKSLQKHISIQYRDMIDNLPSKQFNAIVILEAIEHTGRHRLNSFIAELYKRLKPGGILYIQATGRYKPKQVDSWILKYVFPGGHLPAKSELLFAANSAGFIVEKFVDDTPSYILTLTEWIKRLEASQSKIIQKFGQSFYRLWVLWMHGAKVSFEVNSMNLFRIKLRRPE